VPTPGQQIGGVSFSIRPSRDTRALLMKSSVRHRKTRSGRGRGAESSDSTARAPMAMRNHRALGCLATDAGQQPSAEPALQRDGLGRRGQGGALPRRCRAVAVEWQPSVFRKQRPNTSLAREHLNVCAGVDGSDPSPQRAIVVLRQRKYNSFLISRSGTPQPSTCPGMALA